MLRVQTMLRNPFLPVQSSLESTACVVGLKKPAKHAPHVSVTVKQSCRPMVAQAFGRLLHVAKASIHQAMSSSKGGWFWIAPISTQLPPCLP